ncbi:N-acetyltransferase [Nocardioides sp. ChNu-153]|uniref:GNAT family N-acetyltransferase n=1 Tax=unclassified Nocardioides TaxID=2615069 RepID=UPI0024056BEA|nr:MULTISPECIES: GNAT family N-acetyltransferase [unclassified Nocardioides]MDF9717972.1 N-acetyltransferase [Nocardioides sp. ChNu-99]MDN7121621.1 N-acetyltransferase [Nocardioides sp. ChNu-153]
MSTPTDPAAVTVVDAPGESRFEIRVDGALAGFATYRLKDHGALVSVLHTEIDEAYAGQGLAKRLAEQVLADLRADGRRILPFCPFFRGYLAKHPDQVDLVPAERRADFDL